MLIWRPVVNYEDRYEVSNTGIVARLDGGKVKYQNNGHGYMIAPLCRGKHVKQSTVASIVMAAFVGPRPEGLEIAHLNGVRNDNRLENLAYVTPKENHSHKRWHGTLPMGEKHANAKFTDADILAIRSEPYSADNNRRLARKYRCHISSIHRIRNGRGWKHVGMPDLDVRVQT